MQKLSSFRNLFLIIFALATILIAVGANAQDKSATPFGSASPASTANHSDPSLVPGRPQLPMKELWAKDTEDLSTPSISGSDFAPPSPVTWEMDEYDTFTREITRVAWRLGDPIDVYIMKPVGVKKAPVIIYLYSYPFETDRFLDQKFCQYLTQNGFAAIGFPTALTGQRYHDRPMKEWFVSELRESLATSAHDVQLVLNFLAARNDADLDTNNVGIFGDGSGATIAILAASVDPRIKSLDLLDSWGDWPDWLAKSTIVPENERPGFLKPDFLAGVAPLDPVKWLPELKTQKIRLQEVKTVTVTPDEARQKLEAAAPKNAEIVRYQSAEEFRIVGAVGGFDWLKQQLGPASGAQYRAEQGGSKPGLSVGHPSHP